ncbi:MAG: hypothetical protein WAM22_07960 [Nitrososphaeraceae archaeon]
MISASMIERLEDIKREINKSIDDRKKWWEIHNQAEIEKRKPSQEGVIYPSPYDNLETGELEWRWHILVRKQDLDRQLEHLHQSYRRNRLSNIIFSKVKIYPISFAGRYHNTST